MGTEKRERSDGIMTNGRGKEHGTQKSEGSGKGQRGKGTEIGDWLFVIRRKEGGRHLPTKGTNAHEKGVGIEQKKTKDGGK